jgi:hypothetical protein
MPNDHTIDRKQFLTFALVTAGGAMLGCTSSEPGGGTGGAGKGGGAGGGGSAAGTSGSAAGTSGSAAGTSGSAAGTNGSAAGTSGSAAGTNGSAAGTSGSAAGSGGSGPGGAAGGGDGGVAANCGTKLKVTITLNHGHILSVTAADITAAKVKTYQTHDEPGMDSMHSHFVQLTAADFADLAAGKTVRKASCNEGHEHEYLINCVGAEGTANIHISDFCGMHADCGASGTTNLCPNSPAS